MRAIQEVSWFEVYSGLDRPETLVGGLDHKVGVEERQAVMIGLSNFICPVVGEGVQLCQEHVDIFSLHATIRASSPPDFA